MKLYRLRIAIFALVVTCQLDEVLQIIRPGTEWSLIGDKLIWLDKSTAEPTEKEISEGNTRCVEQKLALKQEKTQAKIDLNTVTKTDTERIDAIIKYLDLNR